MTDITITIPLHLLNNPAVFGPLVSAGTLAISHPKVCATYCMEGFRRIPGAAQFMDKYAGQFADFLDGLKEENAAEAAAEKPAPVPVTVEPAKP